LRTVDDPMRIGLVSVAGVDPGGGVREGAIGRA
jgi:hypothetical protein